MSKITRRQMLMMLGASAFAPQIGFMPQNSDRLARLQSQINTLFANENIGFNLRGWNRILNRETFRMSINGDAYFPVASSFKAVLIS